MILRDILKLVAWSVTLRLPTRLRQHADVQTIEGSALFDADFYLGEYPDVRESGEDAIKHYVFAGAEEGRNPSPYFDSAYYLDRNEDVRRRRRNPLAHYIRSGAREMRNPHPRFDVRYYLETNPQLAKARVDALLHYVSIGADRGARPHPDFDALDASQVANSSAAAGSGAAAPTLITAAPKKVTTRPSRRRMSIDGRVDRYSQSSVAGWARDARDPSQELWLDMVVDGQVWKTVVANRHRLDLDRKNGDGGRHGFLWEFPPLMFEEASGHVKVVAHGDSKKTIGKEGWIEAFVKAKPLEGGLATSNARALDANRLPAPLRGLGEPRGSVTDALTVEVIVLNLNGAPLLEKFFAAFDAFNTHPSTVITIVDHGSTDDSEVVTAAWARRLDVDWVPRHRNFTFSESNNFAAKTSDADVLIFANNDIYLDSDVIPPLLEALSDERLALAGIKLLDVPLGDDVAEGDVRWLQHLGVHFDRFRRDRFAESGQVIAPFETRATPLSQPLASEAILAPAVTGAFMAARRERFLDLGGFHEGYFYGYEDVDLCLNAVLAKGQQVACLNELTAYHDRGHSRRQLDPESARRVAENRHLLDRRFGYAYRRRMRSDLFARPGYWNVTVPRIAFAVSEAHNEATAGDYFTALELARELEAQFPCQCVFLERGVSWYDLSGIDVVVAMLDQYDLSRVENASDGLIKVAWVRNWFDRFAEGDSADQFDLVWASSPEAARYLATRLAKKVSVFPLATNLDGFRAGTPRAELASDYCFTGHYWNHDREIASFLDHEALPFEGKIFGEGWQAVDSLKGIAHGPIPYAQMPDVYASAKVVVDDANHVTKPWGSVNSRVFDAIGAGRLVVTNGVAGNRDIFEGKLPTYESSEELASVLSRYLDDEEARDERHRELLEIVEAQHTYKHRAAEAWQILSSAAEGQLRIAIKIGTPTYAERAEWGDYHFAVAMKRAFDRQGHSVRIDCLDKWDAPASFGDDVVIVLRGLSRYEPRADQINLLWMISHPEQIAHDELESYDHVFVASTLHAETLQTALKVPVSPLLQCTDPDVFSPRADGSESEPELTPSNGLVLVGNSRKTYRRIARDCVGQGIDFRVVGTHWEGILEDDRILSEHVPNDQLASFYAGCEIVLNDHWDSMRSHGFLSNRLFDAAACGAQILTDHVDGLEEIFGEVVLSYREAEELPAIVEAARGARRSTRRQRLALSERIRREHSFDARVAVLLDVIRELDVRKRGAGVSRGDHAGGDHVALGG